MKKPKEDVLRGTLDLLVLLKSLSVIDFRFLGPEFPLFPVLLLFLRRKRSVLLPNSAETRRK